MRRAGVTGALLVLLAAAGCTSSGGTDPSSSAAPSTPPTTDTSAPVTSSTPTTPSSSPRPSTSIPTTGPNVRPGEKIPQRPEVANTNSPIGGIALSTFWIRTLDWGYATTSSSLARTVYAPTCADCARYMVDFDRARKMAYHFRGGRITISQSAVVNGDHTYPKAQPVADIDVSVAALQVLDAHNRTVATVPAIQKFTYRVWMSWTTGKGQVLEFRKVVRK